MVRLVMFALTLAVGGLPESAPARQQGDGPVLLEVPLMVQAPGVYAMVRAYHDGERFFVDALPFLRRLGYTVSADGTQLTAEDAQRRLSFDFLGLRARRADQSAISLAGHAYFSEGRYLIAISQLQHIFASDVFFDEARLSVQLSSAAELFDTYTLGARHPAPSEVPGPLLFGRQRPLLGGMVASWHVTSQWRHARPVYSEGILHLATSMLGGSIRGTLSRAPEVSYLFDRPGRTWLTRIEAGRISLPHGPRVDAVRLSNVPLASLHLQHTASVRGQAPPHAMVEVRTGGHVTDRAQAGPTGEYRLRVPVYYGSTEAVVRIQPLGGEPPYERRHFVLATPALVPPRRLFYDAIIADGGTLSTHYGLRANLTARLSVHHHQSMHLGVVARPLPFAVLSADVTWPLRLAQASLHLWRRHFSAEGSFISDQSHTQGHLSVSGTWQQWGAQMTGSAARHSQGIPRMRLTPSVFWHAPGGVAVRVHLNAARYGSLVTRFWYATARKTMATPTGSAQIGLMAHGDKTLHSGGLQALFSSRPLSVGMTAAYDWSLRQFSAQLTFQLRTGAVGTTSRFNTNGAHAHSAYGSISIGPEVRFSRATGKETAAVLRLFEDQNGNGTYEGHEPLLPEVDAQVFHAPVTRRPDGTLLATYLEPYASYQVRILEHSISDPWLRPATGYSFSFIADPGHTKVIDLPMQHLPLVRGMVTSAQRSAARLRVQALREGVTAAWADVFRDGGFALRLPPGTYQLSVEDVTDPTFRMTRTVTIPVGTRMMDVTLELR